MEGSHQALPFASFSRAFSSHLPGVIARHASAWEQTIAGCQGFVVAIAFLKF
ncbi:MAG: hypothetical protein H7Z11_06710 [Verrucomicrobia bacterium]|nr:hypothetical protein [Leptolyngbya sp. ES-bin-22]